MRPGSIPGSVAKNQNIMKIVEIFKKEGEDCLRFEDGSALSSFHQVDCCEGHYLDFSDLTLDDFNGLDFDLESDNFFERIEGYGIALLSTNGHPVRVPGYGYNNGWYSDKLELILERPGMKVKVYDITDCQKIRH